VVLVVFGILLCAAGFPLILDLRAITKRLAAGTTQLPSWYANPRSVMESALAWRVSGLFVSAFGVLLVIAGLQRP
jgi:hypothetical protein